MHVKARLHERAVEEGIAKPKTKSFYERHLAPLFRESHRASSSEDSSDSGDEEARRIARKLRRQEKREEKKLMRDKIAKRTAGIRSTTES